MDLEKVLESFDREGYVVLHDLIDGALCEEFEAMLDADYLRYSTLYANAREKNQQDLASKSGEKVVFNLHNKNIMWMLLFEHPQILDILDYALKDGSYGNNEPYYLNNISARSPIKGSPWQQLHLDSNLPGINYPIIVNVLWLLNDFNKENGATRVVPGSHLWKEFPADRKRHKDEVIVEAKKGSAIIFNANLWHGGGENRTDANRWAVALGYARWFIKPSFDFFRNTPKHIFDQMTRKQKELLGFNLIPPVDEFTRMRRRAEIPEVPFPYSLPK